MTRIAALLAVFALIADTAPSFAQMFSYGGSQSVPTQTLSLTSIIVDFDYNGDGDPQNRLDFSGPAYGIAYNRPGFAGHVVFGNNPREVGEFDDDLRFVDASVSAWGNLLATRGRRAVVGLPIALQSNFRSVDGDLTGDFDEAFTYTSVGIGSGLTFHTSPVNKALLDLRAVSSIGMVFRSFEGFAGSTVSIEGDALVNLIELFGRYGIGVGYGLRWQRWNTDESGLTRSIDGSLFDYQSLQHMIRLGINW